MHCKACDAILKTNNINEDLCRECLKAAFPSALDDLFDTFEVDDDEAYKIDEDYYE